MGCCCSGENGENGQTWVHTNVSSPMPQFAVRGGRDSDGDEIFVGRAHHNGEILPAKVIPAKHAAYVAWGGQEIQKQDVEILTGRHWFWMPASFGNIPSNALQVGHTSDGEPLYAGRGYWQGSLTVGKVHPSHGCLYIPYGGGEHRVDRYEILVD